MKEDAERLSYKECPDNCLECESPRRCTRCEWLYGGKHCEKKCPVGFFGKSCKKECKCEGPNFEPGCDYNSGECRCEEGWATSTCDRREDTSQVGDDITDIPLDEEPDETTVVSGTTGEGITFATTITRNETMFETTITLQMTDRIDNNDVTADVDVVRPVPVSIIASSVIGVFVFLALATVCIVCGMRRAHGKRSFFGNGTESSQKDLITSQVGRADYSYVDVPDTITIQSAKQNQTGPNALQVHDATSLRRNRSVPGGKYMYDTVTDELVIKDEEKRRKENPSKNVNVDSSPLHNENNLDLTNNRRGREDNVIDDSVASASIDPDAYNSFSELKERQKPESRSNDVYSHLETARGDNRDLYNTFDDMEDERRNERVSAVFEYAHLNSVFEGKPGSYSYIGVKPKWDTEQADVSGNYHHMALNT
ncbi:uncharacterized protein [Argopecten irradians]|uniref:uncharacterized protein n=1 Tax=Argopecten irradians TaxID=31199 RepID=UPI00371B4C76